MGKREPSREDQDFQKLIVNYLIHIADNQTRIAEAMATLGQILERVVQTTDRTEQIVAGILTRLELEKVSH